MAKKHYLIKRKGHKEEFKEHKLYKSCYNAALNCHLTNREANKIASAVTKKVKTYIRTKKYVSSNTIFKIATKYLESHNKDVAFMYRTHRDVS